MPVHIKAQKSIGMIFNNVLHVPSLINNNGNVIFTLLRKYVCVLRMTLQV